MRRYSKGMHTGPFVAVSIVIASVLFQINTSAFVTLISDIAKEFAPPPHLMSGMQISMLMTLPSLLIVPAILLSGFLAKKMSKKWVMLIGWLVFGLGGLGMFFTKTVPYLLTMRAINGVGIGLVYPQPRALVAELYAPEKRAAHIGYQSMGGGLASIIATLLAGVLAANGWRFAALIFPATSVIVIIFILLGIPRVPAEDKRTKEEAAADALKDGKKPSYGGLVWLLCIVGLLIFIISTTIQVKTSLFVEEMGLYNDSITPTMATSYCSAAIVVGTFLGGLLFGWLFKRMNRILFPVSCLIAGGGYFMFVNSPNLVMAMISSVIVGFFTIGAVMPYMTSRVAIVAPRALATMAVTLFTFFTAFGQFLSTFFIEAVEKLAGTTSTVPTLTVSGIAYLILGVLGIIYVLVTGKKQGA
ncbi:MAG: MFS transporter [Lachnospiraceae bacterium]|nr:MFS transporter [Lachnospiraceae bacterium]